MTRVSVVLCAHNEEAFIEAAVGSVLAQTFTDLELVVLDDRSDDRTPEILASFADPRLRVIRNDQPAPLYALAQRAIETTSAPLVARMDGDDICEPERLARQVAYLDREPDAVAVSCVPLMIDEDNRPLPQGNKWAARGEQIAAVAGQDQRPHLWRGDNFIVNSATIFRRPAFDAVGGYDPALAFGDFDLWLRLARHGRLDILPERLIRWRHDAAKYAKWTRTHGVLRHLALIHKHSEFGAEDPAGRYLDFIGAMVRAQEAETHYWRDAALAGIDIAARLREALQDCRGRSERRLAVYGAGQFARRLLALPVWQDFAEIEVVAILDDNPRDNDTIGGASVVDLATLTNTALDAIVIGSDQYEFELAHQARRYFDATEIRVITLLGRPLP
jgi:GT2 family glycosyltransferase